MTSKLKWTKSHWSVNLEGLLHTLHTHFVLFCKVIASQRRVLSLTEASRRWACTCCTRCLTDLSQTTGATTAGCQKPDGTAERGLLEHSHWQPEVSHTSCRAFPFIRWCVLQSFMKRFVYTDQYTRYAGIQRFQWILFNIFYFQLWSLEGQANVLVIFCQNLIH